MTTKYIVDNLSGQTINGDITINGNLSVTGTTNGLATYKALFTQLGPQTGTTLNDFNDGLIIGETYTITDYQSGDDFSNIADVQTSSIAWTDGFSYLQESVTLISTTYNGVTGTTNGSGLGASFDVVVDAGISTNVNLDTDGNGYSIGDTITILGTDIGGSSPENDIIITVTELNPAAPNIGGCVFISTGEIPTNWSNGSTLVSSGNLVVTVLENNLGYDIEWIEDEFQPGFYLGFNSTTGPLYNTFNRNSTFIQSGNAIPFFGPTLINTFILTYNYIEKDDSIALAVFDLDGGPTPVSDSLYYYPVEIQILQDTDTTPVDIYGEILPSFPFVDNLVGVGLYCDGNLLQNFSCDPSYGINNISDLLILLNSEYPNILGVYSEGGPGGIKLTMSTNFKNQFCSNGILTFEVYSFSV